MKTFLITAAACLAMAGARAETPAGCVQVEVQNVRPQQGQLMVAAYADAESFGKKAVTSLRVAAGDAVTSFQLCGLGGLSLGSNVALTMFQDLDSDGKMNKNLLGMPTEPWGSSGTPGVFGPSWETGRVALDGKTIVVKLSQ
jgi:uncharacterized protein (DUF2141 family)